MKTVRELVEDIKRHTILLCLWVVCLAYAMSLTSNSVWVNVPIAFLFIACLKSLSGEVQIRWKAGQIPALPRRRFAGSKFRRQARRDFRQGSDAGVLELWRLGINAPDVEAALDEFSKAIVNEFVTKLWFRTLSPDQEFPDELANMMNNAFAELALRVKKINLITLVTRDIVDLLASHLELFRKTQAKVGADVMGIASSEERDVNIKQALVASKELHPALVSPDAEYKVLDKIMGGLMPLLLKSEDGNCRVVKYLGRELMACAIMKPVMNMFTPAFINTMIENAAAKSKLAAEAKAEAAKADGTPKADNSKADGAKGSGSKADGTKGNESKGDGTKAEPSKAEGLKAEGANVESPKVDNKTKGASPAAKRTPEKPPVGKDSTMSEVGSELPTAGQTKRGQEDVVARLKAGKGESPLIRFASGDVSSKVSRSESGISLASMDGIPDGASGQKRVPGKEPKENWAQLLEAVNQRKTMALAPEHLDNLWAKGRNYKKREVSNKPGGKPGESAGGAAAAKEFKEPKLPNEPNEPKEPLAPSSSGPLSLLSQATFPPPSKEIPIPSAKPNPKADGMKLEGFPFRNELPFTQNSADPGIFKGDSNLSPEQLTTAAVPAVDDDLKQRLMRRSRSIGAELDGWQALAQEGGEGMNLLKAGGEVGLGPGFDLDLAIRKNRANPNQPEGKRKANLSSMLYNHLQVDVVGAHFEKSNNKTFAVYSVFVTDLQNHTWEVQRRFRNFEQLHRALKEKPHYNLSLPAKRFLSSNLDSSFIRQRCALLDKYLKDLLAIPSIAEVYEVWDFLSANSQTYAFAESPSVFNILSSNVDDAMDDMFRQFRGPTELKPAPSTSASVDEIRRQVMMESATAPPPSTTHLAILNESSSDSQRPARSGSTNVWDDDHDTGHVLTPQLPWPEDDLQHPFGSNAAFLDAPMLGVGRALSEGNSPVGSFAGSELAEDDALAVPPDWGPPKVSVPLLNLVDVIFELQGRGWIRRQVFWIAKQILQIGMGDAIDDFLLSKIQELRKEETVASGVKMLQNILWPDGIFLTKHPVRLANLKKEGSFEQRLEAARRTGIVREIILDRAPAALVSLIGRKQYQRCAKDLFFFLQSGVCIKQFMYCLLEQLLVSTFPELEDLIRDIQGMDV